MQRLFDYGLFIDSQNLCIDETNDWPFRYQHMHPADRRVRYFDSYAELEEFCALAYDMRNAAAEAAQRGVLFHQSWRERRFDVYRAFKAKLEYNKRLGIAKTWRFARMHYKPKKAMLQYLGRQVAAALRDGIDANECIELLEEFRGSGLAAEKIYDLLDPDGINVCSDCGCYHHSDDSRNTVDSDTICESCREGYTYSECMDAYIPECDAWAVYDTVRAYERGNSVDYCTARYGRSNFWEHDGESVFFSYEETYSAVCGCADDEDEDSPSDSGNYLDGYHNACRDFTEINETPLVAALGVELEVYCNERRDCVEAVRALNRSLICEKDGSLDDYHGFEIVTVPYGKTEWAALAPDLLKTLRDQGAVGYQTPGRQLYGIHVNIHRRHFSPLAEARIMMMLCAEKNRDFVRAIAQRESIYNADLDIGVLSDPSVYNITRGNGLRNRDLYDDGQFAKTIRKIYTAGKYAPVNWQTNIAEFRIFNSTLNEVSFMKNLEFVWALVAWTKGSTGSSHCHKDFIKWLNTPQHRSTYPNLLNYLSRKAFFTKGGNRIENTWLSLLNKPVDLDTSELLLAA